MRGFNLVVLTGNAGKDTELRQTNSGISVASVSIAVSSSWQTKDGGTGERTEWVPLIFWGKTAENAAQYLKKGGRVQIRGRLTSRKYTDRNNVERMVTEVTVDEFLLLDNRQPAATHAEGDNDTFPEDARQPAARPAQPAPAARPNGNGTAARPAPARQPVAESSTFNDDDIPF